MADALIRRLAGAPDAERLYREGLRGIDGLARHRYGRRFVDVPEADQHVLLAEVDGAVRQTRWTRARSITTRLRRRARVAYYSWPAPGAWHGMGQAVRFFPRLAADAFEVFYTSPVAWQWLGYEGPPMPQGYLTARVAEP